jgi:hypothetical protein
LSTQQPRYVQPGGKDGEGDGLEVDDAIEVDELEVWSAMDVQTEATCNTYVLSPLMEEVDDGEELVAPGGDTW